jgi:hypothetical protein
MQITLNQDEIHTAVEAYVRGQISIAENQSVNIDFTAGRGDKGLSATLDIRAAALGKAAPKVTRSAPVAEVADETAKDNTEEENSMMDVESTSEVEGSGETEEAPEETKAEKPRSIFSKAAS